MGPSVDDKGEIYIYNSTLVEFLKIPLTRCYWIRKSLMSHPLYRSSFFLRLNALISIKSRIFRQISMVFACQKDSFLRTLKTKVISCKAGKINGKEVFEVVLEDTVLFPEGGGQVRSLLFL